MSERLRVGDLPVATPCPECGEELTVVPTEFEDRHSLCTACWWSDDPHEVMVTLVRRVMDAEPLVIHQKRWLEGMISRYPQIRVSTL